MTTESFNTIKTYADIQTFVNERIAEDTYLDFTTSDKGDGKLSDNNKDKICKAASGFAHQEGGILVWGIHASPSKRGDFAQKLSPIKNLSSFFSELENFSKYAVEPRLHIEHKIIYLNDDLAADEGFVVSNFSKSDELHRAMRTPYNFYRRFGSSFVPMVTKNDMQSLLNRNKEPILELTAETKAVSYTGNSNGKKTIHTISIKFYLANKGKGTAKYPSILLGYAKMGGEDWYDNMGGQDFKVWSLHTSMDKTFRKQLIANAGIVIHPEQEMFIGELKLNTGKPPTIHYKCFAEGMGSKERNLELPEDPDPL